MVGTPVDLYHTQQRRWQRGVIAPPVARGCDGDTVGARDRLEGRVELDVPRLGATTTSTDYDAS
jgi:hypothetical protein